MKGKALGKHSLHEKTAASVLLKPFIQILKFNNEAGYLRHLIQQCAVHYMQIDSFPFGQMYLMYYYTQTILISSVAYGIH